MLIVARGLASSKLGWKSSANYQENSTAGVHHASLGARMIHVCRLLIAVDARVSKGLPGGVDVVYVRWHCWPVSPRLPREPLSYQP